MASNTLVIKKAVPYFVYLEELNKALNNQGKNTLIESIKSIDGILSEVLEGLLNVANGFNCENGADFGDDTYNHFMVYSNEEQNRLLEFLDRGNHVCKVFAQGLRAMHIVVNLVPLSLDSFEFIHIATLSGKDRKKSGRWFDLDLTIGTRSFKGTYTTDCDEEIFE